MGSSAAAAASAVAAATSASNAASSASAASTSAGNAATSESNAAASAATASTQATNASNYATAASTSATNAANSATAAAASFDSFDDRYLGAKASDPSVDNDGNPIITGALYWNTTSDDLRVYNGSAWIVSYLPAPGSSGNVLTSNGATWSSQPAPSGGLEYVVKTANYTVVDKQGVLADTSGGAFTVTLPATPAAGAQVVVADAGASWATNNLTVGRNGSTIGGLAENLVCDITGASVQLVYDGSTWEVYAQIGGNGGTAVTLDGVQTLTNKTIAFADNTLTNVVSLNTVQTLTGTKTFSGTSSTLAVVLNDAAEVATVSATAATGTIAYDITTQSVLYYTSNASANWTVNFRASSGTSLDTALATGQSVTAAFLVTQGATAYYNSAVQVDGSSVTPKWQGGTAPAAGNASGIDAYVYTIIKTGSAAFTVLASLTRFA